MRTRLWQQWSLRSSTVSKYRIELTHLELRTLLARLGLVVTIGFALNALQPAVWSYVSEFYCRCAFVLLSIAYVAPSCIRCFLSSTPCFSYALSVSDFGRLSVVECAQISGKTTLSAKRVNDANGGAEMQLHPSSLILPWGLCLHVAQSKKGWLDRGHKHFVWVLRSECTEVNYRRLCRVINYLKKNTRSGNL